MNGYNDFGKDEKINISKFKGIEKANNGLQIEIPSKHFQTL